MASAGHGTLHSIYASVEESCRVKGWDGVDLLIIGGDFQAVRNQHDLNVTSMPEKYRKMADFHEYYSGARIAPYLTIFVGGNHEASNHLFELFYGGWVAPNIYYIGAANILRLGPLRIAGLSGIWKGYDYRKPHFERLPYNRDEIGSIFHVRELDVRKLLSVRTQVDVGISHDWPQGVEWLGEYRQLFIWKDLFEADAKEGKLGSIAARQCLARLRPPHWFSAHLHVKYPAVVKYPEYGATSTPFHHNSRAKTIREDQQQGSVWIPQADGCIESKPASRKRERQASGSDGINPNINGREQHAGVTSGVRDATTTTIDTAASSTIMATSPMLNAEVIGTDMSRDEGPSKVPNDTNHAKQSNINEQTASKDEVFAPVMGNPDIIDVDFSDEEEIADSYDYVNATSRPSATATPAEQVRQTIVAPAQHQKYANESSCSDEDGGMQLNPAAASFRPMASMVSVLQNEPQAPSSRTTSHHSMEDLDLSKVPPEASRLEVNNQNVISDDMRAKLAELNPSFAKQDPFPKSPALPHPEGIWNKATQFLALDKCERSRDFLQLLEVDVVSDQPKNVQRRPYKLQYDPEWLAILRVFGGELQLGGSPNDRTPQHRGDTYYRKCIIEQEEYIKKHVVEAGLIEVPDNFSITAPVYDPVLRVDSRDMPREVTNPQTSAFCSMLGIDNPFDISEEERDARVARGSCPEQTRFSRGHGRGGRGGSKGAFNNRGGRGRGTNRGNRGRGH